RRGCRRARGAAQEGVERPAAAPAARDQDAEGQVRRQSRQADRGDRRGDPQEQGQGLPRQARDLLAAAAARSRGLLGVTPVALIAAKTSEEPRARGGGRTGPERTPVREDRKRTDNEAPGARSRFCRYSRWPAISTIVSMAPNRVGSAITVSRSVG